MNVFCDMDGVLADLDSYYKATYGVLPPRDGVEWAKLPNTTNFFAHIPPMEDALQLWAFIRPFSPIILTGIPPVEKVPDAANNKIDWAARVLHHSDVVCCRPSEKYQWAKPGDILIDDREKYRHRWEQAGGIWITHTGAFNSIRQLKVIFRDANKLAELSDEVLEALYRERVGRLNRVIWNSNFGLAWTAADSPFALNRNYLIRKIFDTLV